MSHTRRSTHGLTPNERAIMDRWDAGQSIRQIARELGRDYDRVRNLIVYYHGRAEYRNERNAMAACSAALLAAIRQAKMAQGCAA